MSISVDDPEAHRFSPDIADEEILDVLSSNLCCGIGYQNIVKAVRSLVR